MPQAYQEYTEFEPNSPLEFSKRETNSQYWTIAVFVLALALFAWVRLVHQRKLQQLFKCFISSRFVKQVMREELVLSHGASIVLAINFVIVTGLLLWLILPVNMLPPMLQNLNPIIHYILCIALVSIIYVVKTISIRIVHFIIKGDFGAAEYIYNLYLFNNMLGLFLMPLLIAIIFAPPQIGHVLLPASLIAVGVFYVLRLFRGVLTAIGYGAPPVYLFLYLCTLEILPLVVGYTWFMSK